MRLVTLVVFTGFAACASPPTPEVATIPAPSAEPHPSAPTPITPPPKPTPNARPTIRHVNTRCENKPCTAGEICVESHTGATMVDCVTADPCAGAPLTCACAASLCGGSTSCVEARPGRVVCDSGGLAP